MVFFEGDGHPEVVAVRAAHIEIRGAANDRILTPAALDFVQTLEQAFGGRRRELLVARAERWQRLRDGELPDFPAETREIREGDWRVPPAPADLRDRRV